MPEPQPPIHQVENIPTLPPGVPATDTQAPKVALTGEQIAWLRGLAGDLWPTIVKWWPVFALAFGLGYGGGTVAPPTTVTGNLPAAVKTDDSKKMKSDLDELLKINQQQKVLIDQLTTKKGTP